jgi:hypothetical protein
LFIVKKSYSNSDLVVEQTFRTRVDLVNVVKQWHIACSLEYRVQSSNQIFV